MNDNVVYHLSVATGSLREVAKSTEEFRALLQSRHFVENEFAPKIVNGMRESGVLLEKEQVYSFKILPCLGGYFSLDNLQATNVEVHFSIAGQIYNQLEDLPTGATIDSIKLNLEGRRPWWRFW
nr:T6SS immunity protein Tdi1 domain-containing protein [Microbulbifer celer]